MKSTSKEQNDNKCQHKLVKCAVSSVTIKLCETDKNNNLDMLRLPALLKPIRL